MKKENNQHQNEEVFARKTESIRQKYCDSCGFLYDKLAKRKDDKEFCNICYVKEIRSLKKPNKDFVQIVLLRLKLLIELVANSFKTRMDIIITQDVLVAVLILTEV
jgi:hypothetical protein